MLAAVLAHPCPMAAAFSKLSVPLPLQPCTSAAAQRACSLLATFFKVSLDPKTPGARVEGDCDPCSAALDPQGGRMLGALWGGAQAESLRAPSLPYPPGKKH